MNVLVCGARGFIGRHIVKALETAGHRVLCGARQAADVLMDFNVDTTTLAWLPRLQGVDAVVNAVGVLRDSRRSPMQNIHAAAPMALFEACVQEGIQRVVHISALGIASNPTRYASTKLAAETALLEHTRLKRLQGVVLRPSIVFGRGGESSALFVNLARLPLLVLPAVALQARVQPLRVEELAEAVAALLGARPATQGIVNCTGPQSLTLAAFIASLRSQRGNRPACVLPLSDRLSRLSARAGDLFPFTPWGSETLALLAQDNSADPTDFENLLGRTATHHSQLLGTSS